MAERQFDTENFSLGSLEDGSGADFLGIGDTSIIGNEDLHKYLTSDINPSTDPTRITDNSKDKDKQITTGNNNNDEGKKLLEKERALLLEKEEATNQFTNFLTGNDNNTNDVDNNNINDNDSNSKVTENKNNNKDDKSNNDTDGNTFDIISKQLFKSGVFNLDENEEVPEIKSPEEFLERFNSEKKKGSYQIINNFLNQFGDEYKEMFDAVFINGIHPYEFISGRQNLDSIKGLDPTNSDHAKQIFRSYFKSQGMPDEKIEKQLQKAVEFEFLEDNARDFHEVLVQQEEQREASKIEDKKKELVKKQRTEYEYQQSVSKILTDKIKTKEIDGIPLNDKEAQEVYTYLVNKPYKLDDGSLLSQFDADILSLNKPENHETKVKLALLLKNKLDLSKVKQKAISNKSEALFENLVVKDKTDKALSNNKVKSIWDN